MTDKKQQAVNAAKWKAQYDWQHEGSKSPPKCNPHNEVEFAAFFAYLDEFEKLERQNEQSI